MKTDYVYAYAHRMPRKPMPGCMVGEDWTPYIPTKEDRKMGLELLLERGLDVLLDRGRLDVIIGGPKEVFEILFQVELDKRSYKNSQDEWTHWYRVKDGQEISMPDDLSQYFPRIDIVPRPRSLDKLPRKPRILQKL